MTTAQIAALTDLCDRYKVPFDPEAFHTQFDLPPGYVAGWVGQPDFAGNPGSIYVGCSPEGEISS